MAWRRCLWGSGDSTGHPLLEGGAARLVSLLFIQKHTLEVIRGLPAQAMSKPKGIGLAFNQDRTEPGRGAE